MPIDRLHQRLAAEIEALAAAGTAKGRETVIAGVVPAEAGRGPRYRLEGEGARGYLRMNANNYLGLARHPALIAAAERAAAAFGVGPGAVRFISGTYAGHRALEARLAGFHGREAAMIMSSAYAVVMAVLPPLITPETAVISDALNHNCIINAIRLARPKERRVVPHLDLAALEAALGEAARTCRRAIVVTDGVFSMRGDHAPLDRIMAIARVHDSAFAENVIVLVDDSHGVGALGATGRGTEEETGAPPADLLVGTLGKALGVNGGYVAASRTIIDYLREAAALYIYSNPIGAGEAAAALAALELLDGPEGARRLADLRRLIARLRDGLARLGLETVPGAHPIVPLLVRDSARAAALVHHLRNRAILATAIAYPVVPQGEEEIRFQVSAEHTEADIDELLAALAGWPSRG